MREKISVSKDWLSYENWPEGAEWPRGTLRPGT
jgi:hypothetical protein